MKKVLCTICMRANSKGLVNKNLKLLNGKPLMYYTINQAQKSKIFDEIVVSSDSQKILNKAKNLKIKNLILRPKKLASDTSGKLPAIKHALLKTENKLNKEFDYIIDLDVTSPLRSINDIKKSLALFKKKKAENLFTVNNSKKSPYFNMVEIRNFKIGLIKKKKNILRRQDTPRTFDLNASIYIWKREILIEKKTIFNPKTCIYKMPFIRSIDIDSLDDFKIVDLLIKKND